MDGTCKLFLNEAKTFLSQEPDSNRLNSMFPHSGWEILSWRDHLLLETLVFLLMTNSQCTPITTNFVMYRCITFITSGE